MWCCSQSAADISECQSMSKANPPYLSSFDAIYHLFMKPRWNWACKLRDCNGCGLLHCLAHLLSMHTCSKTFIKILGLCQLRKLLVQGLEAVRSVASPTGVVIDQFEISNRLSSYPILRIKLCDVWQLTLQDEPLIMRLYHEYGRP